jgi:hypothetical protein
LLEKNLKVAVGYKNMMKEQEGTNHNTLATINPERTKSRNIIRRASRTTWDIESEYTTDQPIAATVHASVTELIRVQ